jgi:hypothetical protein
MIQQALHKRMEIVSDELNYTRGVGWISDSCQYTDRQIHITYHWPCSTNKHFALELEGP